MTSNRSYSQRYVMIGVPGLSVQFRDNRAMRVARNSSGHWSIWFKLDVSCHGITRSFVIRWTFTWNKHHFKLALWRHKFVIKFGTASNVNLRIIEYLCAKYHGLFTKWTIFLNFFFLGTSDWSKEGISLNKNTNNDEKVCVLDTYFYKSFKWNAQFLLIPHVKMRV